MQLQMALLLALFSACAVRGAEVAVIVHPEVASDSLSKQRLHDYYIGDIRSWSDGSPLVVVDLRHRGSVRQAFYKFLGKSPSRMKSIWMKNMLAGEGDPPEALESEEEVVKKVAATPGALGFVSVAKAGDDVRTLIVIPIKEE